MTEIPQAIIDRDVELRAARAKVPPTDGRPRDTGGRLASGLTGVALLREAAILAICEREGKTEDEAIAIVDTPPALTAAVERAHDARVAREAAIRSRFDALALPISPPELYDDVIARHVPQVDATKIAGDWLRNIRARRAGETTRFWTTTVMLGGVGLGKTASAGLCAVTFLRWGLTAAYVEESELVHLSKRRTLQHEAQLEALLDVDLLILDELGTAKDDPNEVREAMRSAFTARVRRQGAHTMMLGNLADDIPHGVRMTDSERRAHVEARFATAYGARLVDRLTQMGTVAHLVGPSMRGTPYVSPRARR